MNFFISPAKAFIAGFTFIFLILFIPLVPGILVFSGGYGGDGVYLDNPPSDAKYASAGRDIIPDGEFLWPISGINRITSGYGIRFHPIKAKWAMHYGVDIGAPEGKNIMAIENGVVSFSGTKSGYGKVVIVEHENSMTSLYAHCSKLLVSKGKRVKQGDVIAKVGNSGVSSGNHLHLEIRFNNIAEDPLPYVTKGW